MDDATFKARKAAQAPELMTLVDDVRHWVEEHLETKHPQRANKVYRELELLLDAVRDNPEESQAALAGARAMWHMLFADADRGARQRHLGTRQKHEKASGDAVLRVLHQLQQQGYSKTKAVPVAAEHLECSQRHIWKQLAEAEKD